jgi:3-(3-hydroxy-phenyl)propionate hydroxylase
VSPFGARGANSGIQDANNLGWKLDAVLKGAASDKLLASYCAEREFAADENILNSTRATDFITPKSDVSLLFRDAALSLAKDHPFARRIVNSGRLSLPSSYLNSPLNTADEEAWNGGVKPGAPALDAPVKVERANAWFMDQLTSDFATVTLGATNELVFCDPALNIVANALASKEWIARYDAAPGTTYLFRPDHHVAARWRAFDESKIRAAIVNAYTGPQS